MLFCATVRNCMIVLLLYCPWMELLCRQCLDVNLAIKLFDTLFFN